MTPSGKGDHPWLSRIAVRDDNGTTFVPVAQIFWIESANRYVVIHTSGKGHIARHTMQSLEEAWIPPTSSEFIDPYWFEKRPCGAFSRCSMATT
jgi:LytTr DNA-binding domain